MDGPSIFYHLSSRCVFHFSLSSPLHKGGALTHLHQVFVLIVGWCRRKDTWINVLSLAGFTVHITLRTLPQGLLIIGVLKLNVGL